MGERGRSRTSTLEAEPSPSGGTTSGVARLFPDLVDLTHKHAYDAIERQCELIPIAFWSIIDEDSRDFVRSKKRIRDSRLLLVDLRV